MVDFNGGLKLGTEGRHRISLRLENALDEEYATRMRTGERDGGTRMMKAMTMLTSFRGTPRTLHLNYSYRF